jgi:alpha-tubulin suppressor-like RCC1 family protein
MLPNMRLTLLLLLSVPLMLSPLMGGCGLFGELPEFQGNQLETDAGTDTNVDESDGRDGECSEAEHCPGVAGTDATCNDAVCEYSCKAGKIDLDGDMANGCEYSCEPTNAGAERCDGEDNDCNGVVDDLFRGGVITAGTAHTCATTAGGDIYCWGSNTEGQLGLTGPEPRNSPTKVTWPEELEASTVSAGGSHTCIIDKPTQKVYCWGDNRSGQVGDEALDSQVSGVRLTSISAIDEPTAVSAGKAHTCAIDGAGEAFCWGDNAKGQLGSSAAGGATPTLVDSERTFDSIDAGAGHTCGASGKAYCWGENTSGQLGTGDNQSTSTPVDSDFNKVVASISAGETVTCARSITPSDEIHCWGNGVLTPTRPADANGDITMVTVSVGNAKICGLTDEGDALCKDAGEDWQEFTSRTFVDIAVGAKHTCAITDEGRVFCWGSNSDGQIGNGSTSGTVPQPQVIRCATD